jgi:hypothetical protein
LLLSQSCSDYRVVWPTVMMAFCLIAYTRIVINKDSNMNETGIQKKENKKEECDSDAEISE